MVADAQKFSGLYKGVVVSNVDPYEFGRLLVRVEDVLGSDPCIWAEPATPVAGTGQRHVRRAAGQLRCVGAVRRRRHRPRGVDGVLARRYDGGADRRAHRAARHAADRPRHAGPELPAASPTWLGRPAASRSSCTDRPGPTSCSTRAASRSVRAPPGPTIKVTPAGIDLGNGALTVLPG